MYSINDQVFCLMHGVGKIIDIETIDVAGEKKDYYVIAVGSGKISVKIPVDNESALIRPVISSSSAQTLIDDLSSIESDDSSNWSKRYRDNMAKLKTGDVREHAGVYKSLYQRSNIKTLSAGERKMLYSARQILFSELCVALDKDIDEIELLISNAIG